MKRLLLDTHAFLWWVNDSPELSKRARAAITHADSQCFVSVASVWEMSIKAGLGKLDLRGDLEAFIQSQLAANRFRELPIERAHAARAGALPFYHRDPFDRLLAAQALDEELAMISRDPIFRRYGVKRVW